MKKKFKFGRAGEFRWFPTSCNTAGSVIGLNENGFQLAPIYETTFFFLWFTITIQRNKLRFFDETTGRGKPYGSNKVYSINKGCVDTNDYLTKYKHHINSYATVYN